MSGLNVNTNTTTFDQIFQKFDGRTESKDLRLKGNDLHLHGSKPSGITKKAKQERAQKKADAKAAIKDAIDVQLGKPGAADKLLKNLGLDGKASLNVGDLRVINDAMQTFNENQDFAERGLGDLGKTGTNWKMSGEGSGGVVFAQDSDATKVCLKFDEPGNIDVAVAMYEVFDRVALLADDLPFEIPKHTKIDLQPGSPEYTEVTDKLNDQLTQLTNRVIALDTTYDPNEKIALPKKGDTPELIGLRQKIDKINKYKDNLDAAGGVSKYEQVQNANLVANLTTQEKVTLLADEQFCGALGKGSVLGQFMGLNDHLQIWSGRENGNSNFTNLMYDQSGKLHVIDISVRPPDRENLLFGQTTQEMTSVFVDVANSMKATLAGDDLDVLDNAMTNAVPKNRKGVFDEDTSSVGNMVSSMFGAVTEQGGGTLFIRDVNDPSKDETAAVDNLSQNQKKLTAALLYKGQLEGLEYLMNNKEQMASSVDGTGKFNANAGEVLDALATSMKGFNVPRAKALLDTYIANLRTAISNE